MRHARDEVTAAIEAATRVLSIRGLDEPLEADNPMVTWGETARDGVWAPTRDGQRVRISVPGAAGGRAATVIRPGLRVFLGIDTGTDVIARTSATGLRLVTVLHGHDAPEEFRMTVRLGEDQSLDSTPSGGFDVVHDRYGASVGRFHVPWCCDSLYRRVPAEYRLDEGTIIMTVRHREADALYPVVVDPLYAS